MPSPPSPPPVLFDQVVFLFFCAFLYFFLFVEGVCMFLFVLLEGCFLRCQLGWVGLVYAGCSAAYCASRCQGGFIGLVCAVCLAAYWASRCQGGLIGLVYAVCSAPY